MKILFQRPALWRGLLAAVLLATVWAAPLPAQDAKPVYTLYADGLACPFCAYGIEKQLSAIEGVETVETDLKTGTITITLLDGATLDEAVARMAVEAAGFTLRGFKRGGGLE
jgi:mercuric ion binding protein